MKELVTAILIVLPAITFLWGVREGASAVCKEAEQYRADVRLYKCEDYHGD